jgi:hypothetical protein
VIVVTGAALYVGHAVQREWFWRGGEYDRLARLKAGFDLRYFEEQLGRPVFIRHASDGYTESTFRGRDFWVQAIGHHGEVNLYAVTSCNGDFQPTFPIPSEPGSPVKLESSTLASVDIERASYDFILGASNFHFFEGVYGALEGSYKDYLWGVTNTCNGSEAVEALPSYDEISRSNSRGESAEDIPVYKSFRENAKVNTFAELTSGTPRLSSSGLFEFHGFVIGPNPVLIRSIDPEFHP